MKIKFNFKNLHMFGGVSVIFELATFPGSVYFPGTRPGARPSDRPGARPRAAPGHDPAAGPGSALRWRRRHRRGANLCRFSR